MQQRSTPPRRPAGSNGRRGALPPAVQAALRPRYIFPALFMVGVAAIAFGVQPQAPASGNDEGSLLTTSGGTATPAATMTPEPTWTPIPDADASPAGDGTAQPDATEDSQVAGARSTPTTDAEFNRQSTECGEIQEGTHALSVGQTVAGVSVSATRATVYPVDYFRCILLATGGSTATELATAVGEEARDGGTHVVLVDLWVTNGGRDFAQLNLKDATFNAAGQTFAPLAALGGQAEVIVGSGQGRSVTLVAVVGNAVGGTTGPITLSIPAPLAGGQETAGLYQLFLPTP